CSVGLAYRYFDRKEAFVLALWEHLAAESAAQITAIEPGTVADRFRESVELKLDQIEPYRDTLAALFGAAMNPDSGVAIISPQTAHIRDLSLDPLETLVETATDAPSSPSPRQMAYLLYGTQLLIILVWLYDRTPNTSVTRRLVGFTHETMALVRRSLILPPVRNTLLKLSDIAAAVFTPEDERLSSG
ncbi:MAG: TetR/AcrR family transcriptional regulator, partial [Chloroflexota bacterium]